MFLFLSARFRQASNAQFQGTNTMRKVTEVYVLDSAPKLLRRNVQITDKYLNNICKHMHTKRLRESDPDTHT